MAKDKQPFEAFSETAEKTIEMQKKTVDQMEKTVEQNMEKARGRWITISAFFKTSGVATI